MTVDLSSLKILDTFGQLLQVPNGIDSTLRDVCDGDGTLGPFLLSTTGFRFQSTATVDAEAGAILVGTNFTLNGTWDFTAGITSGGNIVFDGANPEILGSDTNGITSISAGVTNILGSNVKLYGDTHATQADDFEVYGSATLQLQYDDSGSLWDFQANDIATTGQLTIASFAANWTNAGNTVADMGIVTTIDINGGTIDGTIIGASVVAAGSFAAVIGTTATFSGNITMSGGTSLEIQRSIDSDALWDINFEGGAGFMNCTDITTATFAQMRYQQISSAGTRIAWNIDVNGNFNIGASAVPASATKAFILNNGVAPTGGVANGVVLYSEDVAASAELKVRDEAGNITVLSPHDFSLIPDGPSEPMAFSYYSERREMTEVEVPEERKTLLRQKTKIIEVEETITEMRDGVAIKVKRTVEQEIKLFNTIGLFNEDGSPSMAVIEPAVEAQKAFFDEDGKEVVAERKAKDAVMVQETYNDPIMEEYEEITPAYKRMEDTGEVKRINVDILKMVRLVEKLSSKTLVYEA